LQNPLVISANLLFLGLVPTCIIFRKSPVKTAESSHCCLFAAVCDTGANAGADVSTQGLWSQPARLP